MEATLGNGYIELHVEDLINDVDRCWCTNFISSCFNERDLNLILSISLSKYDLCDGWLWLGKRNKVYSVKSRYRLLRNHRLDLQDPDDSSMWSRIWKINALPKFVNFVWRVLANCFLTQHRLL